jgi:hypothetical protein
LKAAKLGIRVAQRGDRLSLRATFPPRPDSNKAKPYQQYLPLEVYANPSGFKHAESEAHRVATLLGIRKFDWTEFLMEEVEEVPVVSIPEWIERLEKEYFGQRARNKKSQETWNKEYFRILKRLPEQPLTIELLTDLIYSTPADTRVRRRTCYAARALAEVANLHRSSPTACLTPLAFLRLFLHTFVTLFDVKLPSRFMGIGFALIADFDAQPEQSRMNGLPELSWVVITQNGGSFSGIDPLATALRSFKASRSKSLRWLCF